MMDITKVTAEELRGSDKAKWKELEAEVRQQLAHLRMDIYSNGAASSTKKKQLKRSLARLKTVQNESRSAKSKI